MDLNAIKLDNSHEFHIKETDHSAGHGIAIIGLALRMPRARDKKEFWVNLKEGIDCITDFPVHRRKDTDAYLRYLNSGGNVSYKKGGYLDNIDTFDYPLFGLSPKEACLMDPNQRIFLETAWEALEDAGYGGKRIMGSETGVYLGFIPDHGYKRFISQVAPLDSLLAIPGNLAAITASRISYILDLRGPAIVTDTACSSSLVCIHQACYGIKNGDCDMAIAGGIKLLLLPVDEQEKFDIESPSAETRAFDEAADGTSFGEGIGVVLLKSQEKARRDRDHIYAVINGSAINQDGSSAGLTAPNAAAQARVIEKAWKSASIDPATISFIEAHGTGTRLGDPIEIDGLTRAFAPYTSKKQFCALGSIKTNIGHLDSASGIAGLIKAVLALEHKFLPPSLHFKTPNREINFDDAPVFVNRELLALHTDKVPLRCGVSAFGLSGTNCHIILEEAPELESLASDPSFHRDIFTLSAKEEGALSDTIGKYILFLETNADVDLNNLCYTVNTGRNHFGYRLAVVVSDVQELKKELQQIRNKLRLSRGQEYSEKGFYGFHKIVLKRSREAADNVLLKADALRLSEQAAHLLSRIGEKGVFVPEILRDLARLYVEGAGIEWDLFYGGEIRNKLSLPTYSFASHRCWLPVPGQLPELFTEVTKRMEDYIRRERSGFHNPAAYPPAIEEYAFLMVIKVLGEMGIIPPNPGLRQLEEIILESGAIPKYHRFVSALLDILEKADYLEWADRGVYFKESLFEAESKFIHLQEMGQVLRQQYPGFLSYIEILEKSIASYGEVLKGRVNGTTILFPDSSTDLIENIYKDDRNNDSCNALAAQCVVTIYDLISANPGYEKIRILEVGSGIGGTSEWILKALGERGKDVEYYYTDISPALVMYGKKTYGERYPFVTFNRLDLEKDLPEQGFLPYSFDIILGANVIHATGNIGETLDRLTPVLKDNGFLLLVEGIRALDFSTLAFGILEGWWLYEDEELRIKNATLLNVESWKKVLGEHEMGDIWVAGEEQWNQRLILSSVAVGRKTYSLVSPGKKDSECIPNQGAAGPIVITGRAKEEVSETEKEIAHIWCDTLGLKSINIFDDFFSLGGDSIIATRILNAVNSRFQREIDFSNLLDHCCVEKLAQFMDNPHKEGTETPSLWHTIAPVSAPAYDDNSYIYPVTSEQKRIFALCQLAEFSTVYNIPGKVYINGPLDRELLKKSFDHLVARHETLRTSFEFIDGELMQRIYKRLPLEITVKEGREADLEWIQRDFIRPFTLRQAPLLRVQLTTLGKDRHLLLIDVHHIISDGISINILIREFAMLYGGTTLPPLKIQYKAYAAWQQSLYAEGLMKQQEAYWLKTLGGELPVLNLPTDYQRPHRQNFEGETLLLKIDTELYARLNQTAAARGATLFMFLLAAYTVLLSKYTNQDDILVGTPIAGRRHKDLEQVIGIFVNTLVMRNKPKPSLSFSQFLAEVKENCLKAYENQDYQFDLLVDLIDYKPDLSRNPIFDTVFAVQNINDVKELVLGDLTFSAAPVKTCSTRFALYINTLEKKDGTFFELQYCTKLFKHETAVNILNDFITLLKVLVENPEVTLKDLNLHRNYQLLDNIPEEDFSFNL